MAKSRPLALAALAAVAAIGLTSCETVADATNPALRASMTGSQEVPGPGDTDGSGSAEISVVDATDNVCFDLTVRNIATATAAHIHRGESGVSGPPVITLEAPADGSSEGCISAPGALADEIYANPAGFYVNVHNSEFPNGAVRGQLARS